MIRVFHAFGKSFLSQRSDLSLFTKATEAFSIAHFTCPKCCCKKDGTSLNPYSRYMISFENGHVVCRIIEVKQVQCNSCEAIHAILPDCLVPYSSYSLSFILTVLRAYFFRSCSVDAICEKFSIAVSTLYAWRRLFLIHKKLWLGVLKNTEVSALNFIDQLDSFESSTEHFFHSFGFSFMQHAFTTHWKGS